MRRSHGTVGSHGDQCRPIRESAQTPTVNKCTEGENEEDTCFAASPGFRRNSDFLVVALCHWALKVLDSTFGKQFEIADLE